MSQGNKAIVFAKYRNLPTWRLLCADHAPVILGILEELLIRNQTSLPSSIFHDRVNQLLEASRSQGFDLPQTAQSYIAQWLASGFLERTFPQGASEEMYEASVPAIKAIRFIDGLGQERRIATESRLALVISQLTFLADQTDANKEHRIQQLNKEKAKIDAQIRAIEKGQTFVLEKHRALERTEEILALAQELINDFRQVREDFHGLNRNLREQIMENEGSRGDVLQKLFAGVDLIAESDSGRTFKAFWRLLTDPEQSMELETAVDQIITRDFSKALNRNQRLLLLQLVRTLLDQGGSVHDSLQDFARSLKQFVQSKAFREQRRLGKLLKETQKQALKLKDKVHASNTSMKTLDLTTSQLRSVSQYKLYDPSKTLCDTVMYRSEAMDFSLLQIKDLICQSEINFRQLKEHIAELLKIHSEISIGNVLKIYPAEQGLGSIVGYLSLGSRYGVVSKQKEKVSWSSANNIERHAFIPCIYFLKEKINEFL